MGDKKIPVASLSKLLDPVSQGWPECIQAVAATALLVEESRKFTFGGQLIVATPHQVKAILTQKAGRWLTDSRILKYEAILIEKDDLTITTESVLNPASFLSKGIEDPINTEHNCLHLINYQAKVRLDLQEVPLEEGEILFTDGSSKVVQGKRCNGYCIIEGPDGNVEEMGRLPSIWSAQTCELYALNQALK